MRLRVATLNVWAIPFLADRIGARMREIGRRLDRLALDAIGFQEVWTPRARRALIEAGSQAGLVHVWHRRRWVIGGGLLVLSRLPIDQARFQRFALRGGTSEKSEWLGGKGFAELVLRTPAGPISIVNTHLHAGTVSQGELGARVLRIAQIVELAGRVRTRPEPVLVFGDLNCQSDDPEYGVLRGLTALRDLAAEAGTPLPTALRANPYRLGSPKADRRIDYVWARDGEQLALRPVSVERVFAEPFAIEGRIAACSDHAGVLAEVEVAPTTPSPRESTDVAMIELASHLLGEGTRSARRARRADRTEAGIGIAAAVLAVTGSRTTLISRRALLRHGLSLAALAALAPSLEASLSAEWFAPSEIGAFAKAQALLASMRAELPERAS